MTLLRRMGLPQSLEDGNNAVSLASRVLDEKNKGLVLVCLRHAGRKMNFDMSVVETKPLALQAMNLTNSKKPVPTQSHQALLLELESISSRF